MSDVPLKEHIETQLRLLHDAVEKAEEQLNSRLGGMNEFRESLRDQTAKLMTRAEYDYAHKSLEEKIRSIELAKANLEGKTAIVAGMVSIVVSIVVGVVIFVVSRYIIKP